jgi:hypothetical protein
VVTAGTSFRGRRVIPQFEILDPQSLRSMRFNHVFYTLLGLSGVSAFALPPAYTEPLRPKVGVLLAPVAQPARSIAGWATGRWGSPEPRLDDRPADAVYAENQELKVANARMAHELDDLRKIATEWEKVGPLRDRCTAVTVAGGDAALGTRDSLSLKGGAWSGLADGMYVLRDRDVVGRLVTGKVGAQVRLVTDPQTKVRAYFGTFRKPAKVAKPGATVVVGGPAGAPPADADAPEFVRLNLPVKLVEGAGHGKMVCRNLPFADAVDREGLKVGDWAMIEDPDWPKDLQGWRLGVVTAVRKTNRMMAEIEVQPERNLLLLSEVMVLTKEK